MTYASGSKFFRLGPAIRPTRPKSTKEPIPKPAAQGLKPPIAKEATKFIILKHRYLRVSLQIITKNIPILRHFFVIMRIFYLSIY